MNQLCYGWMKSKVESGSLTKTPRRHRSVCIGCFIPVLVGGAGGRALRGSGFSLTKVDRCGGNPFASRIS